MDRLFVFSNEGLKDRENDDFRILHNELKRTAVRNLDYAAAEGEEETVRAYGGFPARIRITVPVGDLNFVRTFLEKENAADAGMTPLEIPPYLRRFAGREYFIAYGREIKGTEYADASKWFVKDASELKSWNSLLYDGDVSRIIDPDRRYAVSRKIEIVSEYRCFVYEDEVQAVQRYAGNPLVFPNGNIIGEMTRCALPYERPDAYTLDIAVMKTERGALSTVPLEMHPFVSCGLYGFVPDRAGDMLEAGYRWYLEKREA